MAVLATLAVADEPPATVEYPAAGSLYTSVRPTGVGLPQIGATGPIGANELPPSLRAYHDSGAYDRDLTAVAAAADAHLKLRLEQNAAPAKRKKRCKVRYTRVSIRGAHGRLYRRVRRCRRVLVTPPRLKGKSAIVFDLDETALSNYDTLAASNFSLAGIVPAAAGVAEPLGPVLALYRSARERDAAIFFISSRPPEIRQSTESNLRSAGYDSWTAVYFNETGAKTAAFKAATRAEIERQGYEIVANVGDQESDLNGGHADRAFKLPNPFYFLPD